MTRLVDDLDGSDASQKILLGLAGEWRALDLSDENADALMKDLGRYWEAASPVRASSVTSAKRQSGKAKAERDYDISMLREWAAEKKVDIPSRGRIAGATVAQFKEDLNKGWQPRAS
jgi:hypothetical protein